MLIAKEEPFEKLTPAACRTAFPLKLRAPDGSLLMILSDEERKEKWKRNIHNF